MIVAATIGPTPNISVSVVFDAVTAVAIRFLDPRAVVVDGADIGEKLAGEVEPGVRTASRFELVRATGRLAGA